MKKCWTRAKRRQVSSQKRKRLFRNIRDFLILLTFILFGLHLIVTSCQYRNVLAGTADAKLLEYTGKFEVAAHRMRNVNYLFYLDNGTKVFIYGEDLHYTPKTLSDLKEFSTLSFQYSSHKTLGFIGNIGVSITDNDTGMVIVDPHETSKTLQDRMIAYFVIGPFFILCGTTFGCIFAMQAGLIPYIVAQYKRQNHRLQKRNG